MLRITWIPDGNKMRRKREENKEKNKENLTQENLYRSINYRDEKDSHTRSSTSNFHHPISFPEANESIISNNNGLNDSQTISPIQYSHIPTTTFTRHTDFYPFSSSSSSSSQREYKHTFPLSVFSNSDEANVQPQTSFASGVNNPPRRRKPNKSFSLNDSKKKSIFLPI